MQNSLPNTGYVRLTGIIGNRKTGVPPLIPVSRSSWWNGITEGRYPKGVKLGPHTTAWKVEDIRALMERLGGAA